MKSNKPCLVVGGPKNGELISCAGSYFRVPILKDAPPISYKSPDELEPPKPLEIETFIYEKRLVYHGLYVLVPIDSDMPFEELTWKIFLMAAGMGKVTDV